ncbi:hypothetical protein CQW23_09932 [Capsicum baccatum]|uniref:E3 ubiquitin protein ligase n=1 Tax=Capsicum baccatum TaxID=33114 RepID=A0A2G2WY94_CAPBA|nr:hypothetical protein CQW23_09932 [Capsicum baccatum]
MSLIDLMYANPHCYPFSLVLEGIRARQQRDCLSWESQITERAVEDANTMVNSYETKAAKIDDQLRGCSDLVQKLAEDRAQNSLALENTQKRLLDVRKSSQQLRETLEELQSKIDKSRVDLAQLQIELEKERFERKRAEEDVEAMRRKILRLRSYIEGSSVIEKLQQKLREYKEILNCRICFDRRKEDPLLQVCDSGSRWIENIIRSYCRLVIEIIVWRYPRDSSVMRSMVLNLGNSQYRD